jgi:antitoxin component of RelBE/YafQ-DinJ toxin-antitoxin module
MTDQAQLAARIDARIKDAVERYCRAKGLKINRFVELALLDRLEELEDIEEVKQLRTEETRPLAEVLRDLKRDGLL